MTAGSTTAAKASVVRRSFTRRRKAVHNVAARVAGEKARVIRELKNMAKPPGAFDASRYFRGAAGLGFYNVGTAAMRDLARTIYNEHRAEWSIEDAMALADALIVDRHLEAKSVGIEIVARYRRDFTPRLLPAWKQWLADNHSANWATTDAICGTLIGPLVARYPPLGARLRIWARDRNMWVRRASAVSLIPSVRQGLALELAYEIARRLHVDEEDLIQKAVGWMLREAGKADPARLERYLRANGPSIPRTTVRYAIERFAAAKRKRLLEITRRSVLDTRERDGASVSGVGVGPHASKRSSPRERKNGR